MKESPQPRLNGEQHFSSCERDAWAQVQAQTEGHMLPVGDARDVVLAGGLAVDSSVTSGRRHIDHAGIPLA